MIHCPVCNQNILPIGNSFNTTSPKGITSITNIHIYKCKEHTYIVAHDDKVITNINIEFQNFSILGNYIMNINGEYIDDGKWRNNGIITIDNLTLLIKQAKTIVKYKAFL